MSFSIFSSSEGTSLLPYVTSRLHALRGWRLWSVTAFLGIFLTLAFPPVHALPFAVIAFTGFFLLLASRDTAKSAFATGWWFGFGHHTVGLYWISIAFGVDDGAFLWMVPFALFLLPAYLALFTGLAGWLFHRFFAGAPFFARLLWLGVLWVASEWGRMEFLYGFPWNQLGNITSAYLPLMQGASIVGVHGLSLWAVLTGGSFALLLAGRRAITGFAALWVVSAGLIFWGHARVQQAPEAGLLADVVRLVQASIPQSLKWDPQGQIEALRIYSELSRQAPAKWEPNYIIWPETAMPFTFSSGSDWALQLAKLVPPYGKLLTGVVRREGEGENLQVWNSLQVVDSEGQVTAFYDKHLLVPFGEFVPLRKALQPLGINKVTPGTLDFSRGEGAKLIRLGEEELAPNVQPLICYEAIFPSYHVPGDQQPDWLLNITNDAWFGFSSGPYQHLAMAQMRAVELGAPMVRVANTGISAVFDAYGHELQRIPLDVRGIADVALPPRLSAPTWYSVYGEFTILLVNLLLITYCYAVRRKKA